jgi:pyruvate dehydrogenase (quinone)
MTKTVADVMVAALKASGVRRVSGIPGDSVNGFTDTLRRDREITWEHVRHEEAQARTGDHVRRIRVHARLSSQVAP